MLIRTVTFCALHAAACLCLGSLLARRLAPAGGLPGEAEAPGGGDASGNLATAFLLGQGALAGLLLLLALAGWFSPPFVAGLSALCVAGGAKSAWRDAARFAAQARRALAGLRTEQWPWIALTLAVAPLLLVRAAAALLPIPQQGDAAAFYFALPKAIAASHRLTPLPGYEPFTQIGLQGELHYAALMSLGSAHAATLFVWATSLAAALVLLAVCAEAGVGRRGKLVALVALFTSTAFTDLISDGKVDLFGAAMGLAAFYWAMRAGGRGGQHALRLAGLFAGLAVVAKLSYVPILPPGILIVLLAGRYASGVGKFTAAAARAAASSLVVLGLWAAVPLAPQVLKNIVLFGEPFAPFLSRQGRFIIEQAWFTPEVTRRIVLTYPLVMFFGQYPMQNGTLSPLILAFAPLALALRRRAGSLAASPLARITLGAAAGVVVWVVLRPSVVAPRYILAPLLLFIPLAAYCAERVYGREAGPRWISAGVLLCLFYITFLTLNQARSIPLTALRYQAGRLSECDISGPECSALEVVNREAAPGERVFLGMWTRYWLRPDLLQCVSGFDEASAAAAPGLEPEARWAYLYERGFRYFIADRTIRTPAASALDPERAPEWLALTPLLRDERFTLLRLESRDPARRPALACRQTRPPAWEVAGP